MIFDRDQYGKGSIKPDENSRCQNCNDQKNLHRWNLIFLKVFTNRVVVFFSDAAPIMTYRFIDQTMQPGPLVSLKCATRGSPTPKITWTLNGRDLPKTSTG